MKKLTLLFLFVSIITIGNAQNLYKSTSGEISFFSETPLENIDAVNKKAKGLINIKTNEVVFVSAIIDFHFKKPLMEEHFNENYMESDKGKEYKTAIFKGKIISDIDYTKNGEYDATVVGNLKIHAITKKREFKGKIIVKDGVLTLKSEFEVKLVDHDIDIPKVVIKKIAETVKVTVNIYFEQKK